ncbi:retrovirus-related pol polyprotein from transposon TNT 1-94 [Tanacetum coccineum]
MAAEVPKTLEYKGGQLNAALLLEDFQDSLDDEEEQEAQKPELRPNKYFEAKYNKVKAKLGLLSFGTLYKSSMVKKKGLVAEAYEWHEEDVSSDDNDMTEVKVLIALADDENVVVGKESTRNGEWVKIYMRKVHTLLDMEDNDERKSFLDYLCIDLNYVEEQRNNLVLKHRDIVQELNTCKEQLLLSEAEGFTLPNHDTSRILSAESQVKITDLSVAITDSPATEYDSADEPSVCSTLLPPLEKLAGAKPISGPKTIKSILKSNSTFKVETLKGVVINEPSPAPAKGNKNVSASKRNSAPTGKLKNVKIEDYIHLSISDIRKPIWYLDIGCSRHITGVKSYMHKYVEQPGPKAVFRDDSTCITEGYGSIKCNGIVFTKVAFVNGLKYNLVSISQLYDAKYIVQFNEKKGTIFNSNKEIVMIAARVRDVYVLDMTSSAQESCFFAKATENLNCLWHKRLAHQNFKTINQLAKQNRVIGLPSLVYSKEKPCSSCGKGKCMEEYGFVIHLKFLAQSVRSSNVIALDSLYLLVLITEASQSRQHEFCKPPTKSLFDVGSSRISIVTVNTKEYHSDVLERLERTATFAISRFSVLGMRKLDSNCVDLVKNRNRIFLRDLSGLGRVVECIIGLCCQSSI